MNDGSYKSCVVIVSYSDGCGDEIPGVGKKGAHVLITDHKTTDMCFINELRIHIAS